MTPLNIGSAILGSLLSLSLAACSGSQLEARLQANPQCKPIFNAKTGSAMPCPDPEKASSQGLVQQSIHPSAQAVSTQDSLLPNKQNIVSPAISKAPQMKPAPIECKPFLHQKTGSLIPCPGS